MPGSLAARRQIAKAVRRGLPAIGAALVLVGAGLGPAGHHRGISVALRPAELPNRGEQLDRSIGPAPSLSRQIAGYQAFASGLHKAESGSAGACPELDVFTFAPALTGRTWIFEASVQAVGPAGSVTVQGLDTRLPDQPFAFDWGDGSTSEGFFPATHRYADTSRNYPVQVTAHYDDGTTAQTETRVWFVPFAVTPVATDPALPVAVPEEVPPLGTRLYPSPTGLEPVSGDAFGSINRGTAEYVLSITAQLQYAYANGDVERVGDGFEQVVLKDPGLEGGMYSLWFTTPVALVVANAPLQLESELSSIFHEMGHNTTLNSPAAFRYGGRIDGGANAIFSETMAQIFQHATVYDLVRRGDAYGFGCDLREAIRASGLRSFGVLRAAYNDYLAGGRPYSSWNDPATPADETFGTFMTIAFKFFEHAEADGVGVEAPLRRMMGLLETFDSGLAARYGQANHTPQADTFRATLMVAALSEAFDDDLRAEFRSMGFPIDDETYQELRARQ